MTKEEIQAGNAIIAKFVGGEIRPIYLFKDKPILAWVGDTAAEWRKNKMKLSVGSSILTEHLEFHTSWDWLMEACKKWDNLPGIHSTLFESEYVRLSDELDNAVTLYETLPAFEQLVENINWLNNRTKNIQI